MDAMQFYRRDTPPEQLLEIAEASPSAGRVRRPGGIEIRRGRRYALREGLHCERIFGPLRADACMCGKFVGAAHRGVVCDRCGVLVGDPALRDSTWAHAESAFGVVHPVLAAAAMRELGVDVMALLDDPAHDTIERIVELEARCRHGLRVHRFPIAPPGQRPLAASPDDPSGTLWLPGVLDRGFDTLLRRIARLDRLVELGAPPIILACELALASRVLAGITTNETRAGSVWEGLDREGPPVLLARAPGTVERESWAEPEPRPLRSMVFWKRDHLVIEGEPGLRLLDLERGTLTPIPAGYCRLLGVVGDVLVVDDIADADVDAACAARWLAAYDLAAQRWLAALPDVPIATFTKDQPEDAALVDLHTGRIATIDIASDRPSYGAHTPDLAHVLVLGDDTGTVFASATGQGVFELGVFPEVEAEEDEDEDDVDDDEDVGAFALVRRGEAWWVLFADGRVGVLDRAGARVAWRVAARPSAACFSGDGEWLAFARGRAVAIHDAATGALLRTLSC